MNAGGPARHVLWVFPGFGVGGAQARFATLANAWGPACRHTIVALNGDLACRERLGPAVPAEFLARGQPPGQMAAAVLQARRLLAAARPDLVVTSNWGAMEWAIGAKLARLPHVHTEDGFGPEERSVQLPRRVWTRRLALRRSMVVLPSRTLERIARTQWRLAPARLLVIPNGIDLARFGSKGCGLFPPTALPLGKGPVIGTIAALRPEKNIARLVAAFAAVRATRPARLVIVGDGPMRPALEAQVAAAGLGSDVLFAGHSTQAERWLSAFDIFALPSDTEQMPLSLLEAMAAGLPVLATDVGDVASMLATVNASFVVPPADAPFADGLERLLHADLAAIGRANRARAEAEFDQSAMVSAWARALDVATVTGA
jgi:glycosyltransferase involved in cell wall biosynthesis